MATVRELQPLIITSNRLRILVLTALTFAVLC